MLSQIMQSNGTINYTITYKNNGGQYAHEVMLKETYDRPEFIWQVLPDPGTIDTWTRDLEKKSPAR